MKDRRFILVLCSSSSTVKVLKHFEIARDLGRQMNKLVNLCLEEVRKKVNILSLGSEA